MARNRKKNRAASAPATTTKSASKKAVVPTPEEVPAPTISLSVLTNITGPAFAYVLDGMEEEIKSDAYEAYNATMDGIDAEVELEGFGNCSAGILGAILKGAHAAIAAGLVEPGEEEEDEDDDEDETE